MEENNKRIFKNSIYLYIRQIVILLLSFISTRIVLQTLGVDNYGVYNVVGGFVALFTVLNNVLQSATRRFMSLAIGAKDKNTIQSTFSTAFLIHVVIAIIVVVALETIGLWLLNNKLNIEADNLRSANWVFQFSVINVAVLITQTPYSAAVTSHEHFNIYAYMSLFDVIAKIAVLVFLVIMPFDKLVVYAALMFAVSLLGCLIYRLYCVRKFEECRKLILKIDRSLFQDMMRFAGWDSFGNITTIINSQGITIMMNMFFNTAVNASRGLATTVTSTIAQFVTGFVQAAEPQLVKYYAQNDMMRFEKLVFNVAQMTIFMLAIIAIPVWMEIDFVLKLWLGIIPEYTSEFIKITVFTCFISYSNTILVKANVAIGRVKQLSLYMAPISIIHLPLVYIALRLGLNPTIVYWVGTIPAILRLFIDLFILKRYVNFPSFKYFVNIFVKNLLVVGLACIVPLLIRSNMESSWLRFIIVCSFAVICNIILMWFIALNKEVKQSIVQKLSRIIKIRNRQC